MIIKILLMDGYGFFVWGAFGFTILSFITLYSVIKFQYSKEKNKFISKFGKLETKKASIAKSQRINREILSNTSGI